MKSAGLISFILAIGCSGWIYSKVQKRTGNNTATAIKTSVVCFLAIWLVVFLILNMVLPKS